MSCNLSFVSYRKHSTNHWCVPDTNNYAKACDQGRAYASDLITYLKYQPDAGVLLRLIAADMDLTDKTNNKGYQVGFFECLEEYLRLAAMSHDPSAFAQQLNARSYQHLTAGSLEQAPKVPHGRQE